MRQAASISHPYVALERAFTFAGLVAALGTAGGGWLTSRGYGWRGMLMATCLALFACAAAGIWAQDMMARFQRGELARIYATAMQGVRDRAIERRAGQPTRLEALSLAFARLVESTRLALFPGNNLAHWGTDMRHAIEHRLRKTESLAASLGEDARLIAAATSGNALADSQVEQRLTDMRQRSAGAAAATAALANEADALAGAIRTVTGHAEQAALIATRLAETAFATQRGVARISDSTQGMLEATDQVRLLLERGETIAANDSPAHVAATVKSLGQAAGAALETLQTHGRALQAQVTETSARLRDMADSVQAQHEFGHALTHAAMAQGDAVGRIVGRLGAAQGDLQSLTADLRDLRLPAAASADGEAARQAVERLPGYAEAMAQILRGLPDYTPVATRSWGKPPGTPVSG